MTADLVRLPDQFRPARSAPTSATPTCCSCCCCCCCVATMISASVVLPMQVEILARRGRIGDRRAGVPPRRPPDDLRARKVLGALAPWIALVGSILVAVYVDVTIGAATAPAVLAGVSYSAFSAFPHRVARVATNTVAIIAAFCAEVVVGVILVLETVGIGYVLFVVLMPIVVIRSLQWRRDQLPPLSAVVPPPFDWPQEG